MNVRIKAAESITFGEHWTLGIEDLIVQATQAVLTAADLELGQIDQVVISNCFAAEVLSVRSPGQLFSSVMGFDRPVREISGGDDAGGRAVQTGIRIVRNGEVRRVLVLGVEKMSDLLSSEVQTLLAGLIDQDAVFQGQTLAAEYAFMARQYIDRYGLDSAALSEVSVQNHEHARFNPAAQFRFPLTSDQVLNSALIADPLRALDAASICDGAAALILEAGPSDSGEVVVLGMGEGSEGQPLAEREDRASLSATRAAAAAAYAEAEVGPGDIDAVEVHDIFSIAELLALEDLGLSEAGQALGYLHSGRATINPSGGLKACGHAPGASGVRQAVEIYKHLKGLAGERQLKEARIGLVHSVHGSGSHATVTIFQRQD